MTRHRVRLVAVTAVTPLLVVAIPAGATQPPPARTRPAAVRACSAPAPGHAACLALLSTRATAPSLGPADVARTTSTGTVAVPTSGYGPADIKSIYSIDTTRGTGQTIAIVDAYDDPHAAADLAAYRSAWKLPACTAANSCLRKVNQRGGHTPPAADPGWSLEISLDLDAVSAACPNCKILLIEADTNSFHDLGTAVNEAVSLGANVVSNSYGGPEYNGVIAAQATYYNHPGAAMVVATGDTGFGPATFPADATRSIAVAGTTVSKTATGGWHCGNVTVRATRPWQVS